MTLEDPAVRMASENPAPAPLAAAPGPSRTASFVFAALVILSIGGLGLGLSNHWQAFSRNAVFALPQSEAVAQRGATPPEAAADQTLRDLAELTSRLAAMDTRVAALERSAMPSSPRRQRPAILERGSTVSIGALEQWRYRPRAPPTGIR